ncbi:MAG: hypothetical protein CMH67_05810 [Nisaea sp.]|nr:hypothetical protein [Nisaea sp.]OUX96507.1 MAG: hypothetical protein CBB86_05930 [Candidatus Endolissoclinum sp. TMED26]
MWPVNLLPVGHSHAVVHFDSHFTTGDAPVAGQKPPPTGQATPITLAGTANCRLQVPENGAAKGCLMDA